MIPKFRAWDKVFKEMVQVNALVLDEQVVKVTYKNGNVAKEDMKEYELMQSTGLKDKNGKEIFEGDILEIQGIRMVVKFGSYEYIESSKSNGHTIGVVYDGLGFYVECINAADPDRISPFEPETLKESVVIGNRFANPEIVEDKEVNN